MPQTDQTDSTEYTGHTGKWKMLTQSRNKHTLTHTYTQTQQVIFGQVAEVKPKVNDAAQSQINEHS